MAFAKHITQILINNVVRVLDDCCFCPSLITPLTVHGLPGQQEVRHLLTTKIIHVLKHKY